MAFLDQAKAELEARRGAPGGHPPVAFGPWQLGAPHPTRPWAWGARHEKTGQRAIVEVCFGSSPEVGESLRQAVEANSQLVPLGAERLLGTNRLILRPDEAWPVPPPSGPYAFWVTREELPTPPPATLGEPQLRHLLESVVQIRTAANEAGVKLDLGPTALVALPDGTIHVRRPGLPPDTALDPDAAALDSIRKMPMDLALTATVARAPNLAALGRDLRVEGFAPFLHEQTVVMQSGTPGTGAGAPSRESVQPKVVPVPFPEPAPSRRGRRRRVAAGLLAGVLTAALLGLVAYGAFFGGWGGGVALAGPSAGSTGVSIAFGSPTDTAASTTTAAVIVAGETTAGTAARRRSRRTLWLCSSPSRTC